jgi:hypothetical protein
MIIYYFSLALCISVVFALFEIQIEGKNGWAEKLPTWKFYKTWFRFIPGGNKPITGYHFYLWLLIFLLSHVVYVNSDFTIKTELLILSFLVFVLRVEDFLWFVFNPNFGIRKFNKRSIPWHTQWLGPAPIQYWISVVFWILLFYFAVC